MRTSLTGSAENVVIGKKGRGGSNEGRGKQSWKFQAKDLKLHNVNVSPGGFVIAWLHVKGCTTSRSQWITAKDLEARFKEDQPVMYDKIMNNNRSVRDHSSFIARIAIGQDSESQAGQALLEELFGAP
ncbi:hypothetical protein JCM16303_004677 [Sporobolomyces ruberrimus]